GEKIMEEIRISDEGLERLRKEIKEREEGKVSFTELAKAGIEFPELKKAGEPLAQSMIDAAKAGIEFPELKKAQSFKEEIDEAINSYIKDLKNPDLAIAKEAAWNLYEIAAHGKLLPEPVLNKIAELGFPIKVQKAPEPEMER
ncbi:MAG: hypothetical protein IKT33_03890, partial [Clostridia bacterium]|nr:hypothetical protein [Clostridia bacterium]